MKLLEGARRVVRNSDATAESLRELLAILVSQSDLINQQLSRLTTAISDQSDLLNRKLDHLTDRIAEGSSIEVFRQLVASSENQSRLLDQQRSELVAGLANQADLLNRKLDHLTDLMAEGSSIEVLRQLVASSENQSQLLDQQRSELVAGLANQTDLLGQQRSELVAGLDNLSDLLNQKLNALIEAVASSSGKAETPDSLAEALRRQPLLVDEKTYNTAHPEYDARVVKNFPGEIFNFDVPCDNAAYITLKRLARGSKVDSTAWDDILAAMRTEAMSVPNAHQIFERRDFIENYLRKLEHRYHAHYVPGWVNLDDALFLYWLVRETKPRSIVQCGVCNGLSSAFMMLALVKNGGEGTLKAIDLPEIFDPSDPNWQKKDSVYGFVIPEGCTSGSLVPNAYRDRFEVCTGDSKELLPSLVDRVDSIDFFYHDSKHTYNHMAFEFREARRKLNAGGLVVADDISWNASLWDFADAAGVPSYNFRGAVGVAFF
jgi:predicted O-methyltransferase YrrM